MDKLADVIKYEGDNTTFIWKSPIEDFNMMTQLIVHESQEALFYMNGQALDLFGPGRYTLETQNIPLLRAALEKPTKGHRSSDGRTPTDARTPYHCEVYFINKTEQMAVTWGTDSKVTYEDPTYHFPLQIGASGEMTLRVEDSRRLLVKVVGTETLLTQDGLKFKFRAFLQNRIKPYLARTMREQAISIFETDEHMGEISEVLHQALVPDFSDYGLVLERFFVTTIVKPDGERNYERFKELRFRQYGDVTDAQIRQQVGVIDQQTDAQRTVIQAGATAEKRRLEGYTYQQERSYDVAEKVAENEAVGEYSNLGVGLGMMGGVASGMGKTVAGVAGHALGDMGGEMFGGVMMQPDLQGASPQAQSPVTVNVQAPPAPGVGAVPGGAVPPVVSTEDMPTAPIPADDDLATFKLRVERLKTMREAGLLSDEEFAQQKADLLKGI
jgi:membrane protease subunit (stomatin/prohibitin family)